MKTHICILVCCITLFSCATLNGTSPKYNDLIIEKEKKGICYFKQDFFDADSIFRKQENYGQKLDKAFYSSFDKESKLKIQSIFKDCLSDENYRKLNNVSIFHIGVVVYSDGTTIPQMIGLEDKNIDNIALTSSEVLKMFDYVKDMKFIYQGDLKGEEILALKYKIPIKKK